MLNRTEKAEQVELLKAKIERAQALVAVDFRGLNVTESDALRSKLRKASEQGSIEYRVAKNTLVKLALRGTANEPLGKYLAGPTAVAFAFEEPAALAKVLVDYAKDVEKFKIKGGVMDGQALDVAAIERLSKLPGKQELRAMLAGTLQAPLRNLAGTLQALLGHVRNALEARQKQLEESGGAAPVETAADAVTETAPETATENS
jgi:large subunit ribosomal protein L10